jgi:hypothetical protein
MVLLRSLFTENQPLKVPNFHVVAANNRALPAASLFGAPATIAA